MSDISFPTSPSAGQTYSVGLKTWKWNGYAWDLQLGITSAYTANTNPPVNPAVGDQWYKTDAGILYEYLSDGTSTNWVDVISPTVTSNPVNVSTAFAQIAYNQANSAFDKANSANVVAQSAFNKANNALANTTGTFAGSLSITGSANISNSVSITYTPPTVLGAALNITANNTKGGTGYSDFLSVTNTSSGVTNPNKFFRLTVDGRLEIINSDYTGLLLSLTNDGDLSLTGKYQVSGKQAVNGPAFAAYAAAVLQTIPTDVQTKVLFQTEEFDTDNCYSSSRFTPTVEGYYQLNAEVRIDGTSGTGEMMIVLYKNGTEYKRGTNQSGTQIAANFWAMQVSSIAYANGSTDYFEIYVQQGSGADRTVTAVNAPAITWFNGCMVRGA